MGQERSAQPKEPRLLTPRQPELTSVTVCKGFRVLQSHADSSGEIIDLAPPNHVVSLVTKGNVAVEGAWRGERWRRWIAFPGSVAILPANAPLGLRWRGGSESIQVELESGSSKWRFVEGVVLTTIGSGHGAPLPRRSTHRNAFRS
jgi:hypothetical protein